VEPVLVFNLNLPSLRVAHPSVGGILERTAKPDEERTDASRCRAEVGYRKPKEMHIEKACAHRANRDAENTPVGSVTYHRCYSVHLYPL